jgi:hypothetical protein
MGALTKGGFVLVDHRTGAIERVLAFQYNPEQLAYTVTAAATEIGLSCGFDATDRLASGEPVAQQRDIAPQLAALAQMASAPPPPAGPVILFVWGAARVATVEISSLTITEQAFSEQLSPLRATVAIALRLLQAAELEHASVQGEFAMAHEASQRHLASSAADAALCDLGLTGLR